MATPGTPHRIAPSILAADFGRLAEEIRAVEEAGADWIHVDVMDGAFVPAITIGPLVTAAVRRATTLPVDVHLMIADPDRYVADFRKAGADSITVHAEAATHLHRSIQAIKDTGARAGVALNPHTPAQILEFVLDQLDLVLVMSVNPGFGGQAYIPAVERKVAELASWRAERGLAFDIEIDGGINPATIAQAAQAGVDVFVAGSAIFNQDDYGAAMGALRGALIGA